MILCSVAVELLDWELVPIYYSIRNDSTRTHMLRSWNFEASHDGKEWVALSAQKDVLGVPQDSSEEPDFRVLCFPVHSQCMAAFRYFRIVMVRVLGVGCKEWAVRLSSCMALRAVMNT